MNQTTIAILERAGELRLKLGFEPPDTLTVQPVASCPPEFADTLRSYKPRLLSLLALPFVMVRSQALDGAILFFCQDEATRAALVQAGAEEWSIYTKDELRILCEQNRVAPLSPAELRKVHEIKRTFRSRIATDHGG
jgi:hypothetical protein